MDVHHPDDEPVTKTFGIVHSDIEDIEKGDFEIGYCDGGGYIKLPLLHDDGLMRFDIPKEQVDSYRDRRNQITPPPTLPDEVDRECSVTTPETWEKGTAVHTGGNIWNRIWEQHHDEYIIRVAYDLPQPRAVSIELYDADGLWISEIHASPIESDVDDEEAQQQAVKLMEWVDDGEFDDDILSELN